MYHANMSDRRERIRGIEGTLLRLNSALDGEFRAGAGDLALTPAQAATLRFAGRVRPDVATIGQLARVLGIRHSTAVGIVQPLIARGLVQRVPHPFDRRSQVLTLSISGADLLEKLEGVSASLGRALERLGDDSLDALETGLGALVLGLRECGRLVVAAPCAGCAHFEPNAAPHSPEPHRCRLIRRFLSDAAVRMDCPEHTLADAHAG